MVNFRDPTEIAQDYLALTKFWHALAGLYIWEFFTTLDYEWSAIRGHRPYRWTIWIYSVARVATLMAVILSLVRTDVSTQYNCVVESVFQTIFGYLSFSAASLLIVLRIIAIWNRKKFIIAIVTGVWVTNLGILIQRLVRIRARWVPAMAACVIDSIEGTRLNMIATLITDTVLLLIMLIGLFRLGFYERGVLGMGRLMWRQGLIWLLLATIAEVPPVVLICLNLNDPLDYMFQFPAMITMSIAATRNHRSLTDFLSRSTNNVIVSAHPHPSDFTPPKTNRVPGPTDPLEPMEVAVHQTFPQDRTPQTNQHTLFIRAEGLLPDKMV